MKVMKDLTDSLTNYKSISKLDDIVEKNTRVLAEFAKHIDALSVRLAIPPPRQEVLTKVEHNFQEPDFSEITSSLESVSKSVAGSVAELKEAIESKPKRWEFQINRDTFGRIYSVTATQRTN